MTDQATPAEVRLTDQLGLAPTRAQVTAWMAQAGWQNSAIRQANLDKVERVVRAAVAAERERWIAACNTVSDDAERSRRPGVQTVAQVRKLAIDGPNAEVTGNAQR